MCQRLCKDISPRTEDDVATIDTAYCGNLGNIDSDIWIMEATQLERSQRCSDSQASEETKI
jgi:hypothetical protein